MSGNSIFGWAISDKDEDVVFLEFEPYNGDHEYLGNFQNVDSNNPLYWNKDRNYFIFKNSILETEQEALELYLGEIIEKKNKYFLLDKKLTDRLKDLISSEEDQIVG